MSLESFRDFVNEKVRLIREDADNTEMLINYLNNFNKITIDDFQLLKIIGKGGFATVFLCEKLDTGELFALKSVCLFKSYCLGKEARDYREEPIRVYKKRERDPA